MRNKRILVAILSGILVLGLVVTAVAFWGNGNGNGDVYEPYEPAIEDYEPELDEPCEIELAEAEALRAAERAEREAYWTAFAREIIAQQEAERAESAEARRLAREAECCVDCADDDVAGTTTTDNATQDTATGGNGNQSGGTSNNPAPNPDPPTQTPDPTPDPPAQTWSPCRPGCDGHWWFYGEHEDGGRIYSACRNQPRPW